MPINTPTGYLDITNATLRGSKIVTTGFVGIANANPTNHLSIGSNLHINDTHSNVLQISGNINAASVVLGGISIAPTFDLEVVTNTGNTTPYTVEFNNAATAFVTTANATIGDTLTASKLVGDGSGISAIQSSNVTDFASNVSRITTLETSRALKSDLNNNSSRITNLSSNLSDNSARITNLSSNLSDNSSRITTLESGDFSISGEKTFTGQVIFESNIHMAGGNVFVANTINMTVFDPIMELGSNNLNTGDLGIVMTRHNNNSNIAFVYDESDDILRMGYTLNGASSSVIYLDSNALAVGVQGTMTADKIVASNVIPATSTTTGALTVAGGVGVDGNVHCSNLYANNITMNLVSFSGLQTFEQVVNNGRILNSNVLIISNATPSTSSATGALTLTAGGLGVEGNVHIGSNLFVTGETTLSNLSVTGDATVSNLSVTGETVEVANLAVTSGSLELTQVANVFQVKSSSNVVTEYTRSKKLIKYPRVAMTAATTSGYTASASSDNNGIRPAYLAFDNILYSSWHEPVYTTNPYPNADGAYTGGSGTVYDTNGYEGEYLQIQLPEKIKLYSYSISNRPNSVLGGRQPKDAKIFASNDGSTWIDIHTHSDLSGTYNTDGETRTFQLDNITETYYTYYRLVVNSIIEGGASDTPNTSQWQLYGIPEYDPEAHGTDVIMRSIPNVPNTDWLEVYYDGQDYTSMPSTVTDKSGNSVTGTPTNGVTFDSTWKAFNFDAATNQYITATTTNQAGAFVHTVSMWVKFSELTSSQHFLFRFGSTAGASFTATGMYYSANQGIRVSTGVDYRTRFHPTPGEWVHIMYSYSGGTLDEAASDTRVKFYVNGVRWQFQDYYQGSATPVALNLPGTNTLQVNGKDGANNIIVDMSVANFRLFNRALTGDEAWQLYAYQKEYFDVSPDVVTFKGGRLGIGTSEPRAPLDVMGIPYGPGARPVFFATNDSTSALNITAAGIFTDDLPDAHINVGGCYDGTTGRFTAKIAGTYMFTFHVIVVTDKNNRNFCQTTFYLNGTNVNRATTGRGLGYLIHQAVEHTDGEILPVHINRALYLNVGDYVQVGIQSITYAGVTTGRNYAWFTGYLLS